MHYIGSISRRRVVLVGLLLLGRLRVVWLLVRILAVLLLMKPVQDALVLQPGPPEARDPVDELCHAPGRPRARRPHRVERVAEAQRPVRRPGGLLAAVVVRRVAGVLCAAKVHQEHEHFDRLNLRKHEAQMVSRILTVQGAGQAEQGGDDQEEEGAADDAEQADVERVRVAVVERVEAAQVGVVGVPEAHHGGRGEGEEADAEGGSEDDGEHLGGMLVMRRLRGN